MQSYEKALEKCFNFLKFLVLLLVDSQKWRAFTFVPSVTEVSGHNFGKNNGKPYIYYTQNGTLGTLQQAFFLGGGGGGGWGYPYCHFNIHVQITETYQKPFQCQPTINTSSPVVCFFFLSPLTV